ncbi:DEAD/DEAH box helicase family protein [Lysobacter sp. CA196]|uniref:DEAD/DEAH box helicase family protein n=1 Tax=Lysobacter sp. CA196 TaxID=3455606 RepID=UPI003F8D72FB
MDSADHAEQGQSGASLSGLRQLEPKPLFNTSTDEVEREFLIPALQRSLLYDRGVGFFSSAWLRRVSHGLIALASQAGKARIIASPILSPEDWAALRQGIDAQLDPKLHAELAKSVEDLAGDLPQDSVALLAWMVADELLEFRIATPANNLDGDFHDKFGQFHDAYGNVVAFHGSPNDSEKAFHNYESISCFYSWLDSREKQRTKDSVERFLRLWENRDVNVRVFPLPEAIRRNLVKFTEYHPRPYTPAPKRQEVKSAKWRHQTQALETFISKTNGILAMATGTGKTRTALSILDELRARGAIKSAIITMSGTDLLGQWRKELLKRSPFPVYCAFADYKEQQQFINDPTEALLLVSRQMLAKVLSRLPSEVVSEAIIVCDEVHGLGSEGLTKTLAGRIKPFKYRLGLSATPDREYDLEGNQFIEDEVGPIIFEFGLEDAIERGILCELDYVPLSYVLSDEDRQTIHAIIRAHHARSAAGEHPSPEELYRRIASVRKCTTTKLAPFHEYLKANAGVLERCLIFVENREYGLKVQELVLGFNARIHTYYAADDQQQLEIFSKGSVDCLITCHRISEGIDIKSVNNVVLFSSSRARLETIQRLGRCLRIDDANPGKRALVVDFVEDVDDENEGDEEAEENERRADELRREWFEKLAQVRRKDAS